MSTPPDRAMCARIVRADEVNLAYFATRAELPGAVVFTAERDDAPEFDLALIYRVAAADADAILGRIVDHFRERRRHPRLCLTPFSEPAGWPDRLRQAGFVETDERDDYVILPERNRLVGNPAVVVERAVMPDDADRFSAIQVVGFDVPAEHREWDRVLARRHLAAGNHLFYLASLDGQTVGASRSIHLPGGLAGLSALATLPAARGRRVGASLLRRMADDARAAGCSILFGRVRTGSYAAGYYERLGWQSLFTGRTFALDC
jgi:ribosomal protein S18 acetylase RimI-like enzyme